MTVDAIIFDKDGTLIDFDAFWVSVSCKAIAGLLAELSMSENILSEVLEAFGVRDGATDINGVLCKGTYEEMGTIVYNILQKHGCERSREDIVTRVISYYNASADAGEVKPTTEGLADILRGFRAEGKRLAVVTTDNAHITKKCLAALGIEELFDRIYTDDGEYPTKPDPACVYNFCELVGVQKDGVVMVGDTMTDVNFAKNAGITSIALARTEAQRELLLPKADVVISDISELVGLVGRV